MPSTDVCCLQIWAMQFWSLVTAQQTRDKTIGWSRTLGQLCGVTRATSGLLGTLKTVALLRNLCMWNSSLNRDSSSVGVWPGDVILTGMQSDQLWESLFIARWLATAAGVLCLRGVVSCFHKGLAKLYLCKGSGSGEASSNCKATETANLICQYSFDQVHCLSSQTHAMCATAWWLLCMTIIAPSQMLPNLC